MIARRKICRLVLATAAVALGFQLGAFAQNEEAPPPKRAGVRITFLPPPLEGTLSLGLFDKAGKLVRTLHREATEKDFTVGLNGFITSWDGKTDTGEVAPAGKYFARGFSVGELEVDGVAMHCNEWITDDDSPRIRRINAGYFKGFAGAVLDVELANHNHANLIFLPEPDDSIATNQARKITVFNEEKKDLQLIAKEIADENADMGLTPDLTWFGWGDAVFAFGDGKLRRQVGPKKWEIVRYKGLERVISASIGRESSIWVINDTGEGTEVTEYSFDGEILRRLRIPLNEPAPQKMDAKGDELLLIEESKGMQRARILSKETADTAKEPKGSKTNVSTWKAVASKTIYFSDTFTQVADKLGREKPFAPEEKIRVRLLPNPLFKDAIHDVDLKIAVDAEGAFLQATNGLPLKRVTETPDLKWAVMGRENGGKVITIFQSDGAVVEEFKARKLANMMAFDAGEYEWKPAAQN